MFKKGVVGIQVSIVDEAELHNPVCSTSRRCESRRPHVAHLTPADVGIFGDYFSVVTDFENCNVQDRLQTTKQ